MKFVGAGIVWNPETNKMLGKFEDGILETTDKKEQKILKEVGFKESKEEKEEEGD
jgi:hypothetical protein